MEKPYISFVVTARNDNYGGNWINRINAFIKVLAYQAQRTKTPCELVFVEYNPPKDKKCLYEELALEKNKFFSTRFIIVPNSFHETLPNHKEVTVCEFIAKNIGIRRANSDWIIATNPDTLYGDELFDFFASRKLNKNTFYRINRKDLSTNYIDPAKSPKEILKDADKKTIKILFNNQTLYTSYSKWFHDFIHGRSYHIFRQCPLFNSQRNIVTDDSILHENAAGDFLLMHKNLWEKVRGYDEMTVGSGIMDGYIMYILYCYGYSQKILPYSLFHIYHHHGGVRYLASYKKFRKDAELMLKTKIPYKEYSINWGSPEKDFEEKIVRA